MIIRAIQSPSVNRRQHHDDRRCRYQQCFIACIRSLIFRKLYLVRESEREHDGVRSLSNERDRLSFRALAIFYSFTFFKKVLSISAVESTVLTTIRRW